MDNQGSIKEGENADKSTAFSPPPSALPSPAPLPPSIASSPSHEFFFTISMQTPNSPSPINIVDLAPADDIFFHGHLLPLDDVNSKKKHSTAAAAADDSNNKSNPKYSFSSLFGLWKWLRRSDEERQTKSTRKKKKKEFELGVCFKKHVSMAELLLFFKGKREEKESRDFRRRLHSFSGDSNPRKGRWRRRSGELSPPGSMRASPTSSGLLAATTGAGAFSSSDESTMAELQSAVEAAIAHCKNSIAVKERT